MSYIVHGHALSSIIIGAFVVVVAGVIIFTYKQWHLGPLPRERHEPAHAPGREDGLFGDTGVLPAGDGDDQPTVRLDTAEMRAIRLRELASPCTDCGIDHVGSCCNRCGFGYGTCDCAEYCGQLSCMTGIADMTYLPAPMTPPPPAAEASGWSPPRAIADVPPAFGWEPACGICDSAGHETRDHDIVTATAHQAAATATQAATLLASVMLLTRTRPASAIAAPPPDSPWPHLERQWTPATDTGTFRAIAATVPEVDDVLGGLSSDEIIEQIFAGSDG